MNRVTVLTAVYYIQNTRIASIHFNMQIVLQYSSVEVLIFKQCLAMWETDNCGKLINRITRHCAQANIYAAIRTYVQ